MLDEVLHDIAPSTEGFLFDNADLLAPQPVNEVLDAHAEGAAVVLISDAGAARGQYDIYRLLDTVAFVKALKTYTTKYVWLNPLPRERWRKSTAAQIRPARSDVPIRPRRNVSGRQRPARSAASCGETDLKNYKDST